jgi:hypothetical protein
MISNMPRILALLSKRRMPLVIQKRKQIKMSTVRIEQRKYKSICKEKHKIQPKHTENCNDRMRIYIVSTVGMHRQKHNIPPESRMCVAYKMKIL